MNTVFVTGSTGYIGGHLIQAMVTDPLNRIFGLSRQGNPKAQGWHSIEGDIMHPELPQLLEEIQPDVIFHTIAADRLSSLSTQLTIDVVGTEHLLKALVEAQIPARVIMVSSASEYGLHPDPVDELTLLKPQTEYGICKMAQTQLGLLYYHQFHLPVTVARIFNLYGGGSGTLAIGSLASQIARLEQRHKGGTVAKLKVKNLLSRRDFIHIDDVLAALITLSQNGRPGEIYNVASGEAIPLQVILEKLLAKSTLKEVSVLPQTEQVSDLSQGRINKINIHTGWKPKISLDEGLTRELAYWREQAAVLAF